MANSEGTLHHLGERIKELTALHQTTRILQDDSRTLEAVMNKVVRLLPPAWQYPEITGARIYFEDLDVRSPSFRPTEWMQTASFQTRTGLRGGIEVCYLEERPTEGEGPFLNEERDLIETLAEMLRSHFQQLTALEALQQARDQLEAEVRLRTDQLENANQNLHHQVAEYRRAQRRIEGYQRQLQRLASELVLSEARQRRDIAQDLHDHIGQALAFIRLRLRRLQGDAVFSGFEDSIGEILRLLDQTINSTRSLTFEISPPVLYELGLGAALEWMGERFSVKHGLAVEVQADGAIDDLPVDIRVVFFQAARELLVNAIKHGEADHVTVTAELREDEVVVVVADDGKGFSVANVEASGPEDLTFGLFSIRERLNYLGGSMTLTSHPGRGTRVTLRIPTQLYPDEMRR